MIENLYTKNKKNNAMKINRIYITTSILLVFFHFFSLTVKGQSVFAPKIGAEWNYFVETDSYTIDVPYFNPITGIVTVNYTKDTLINGLNMKKFEQKWQYKKRKNDTLFGGALEPSFMTQIGNSVFLLVGNTLKLAFVYETQIGTLTRLTVPPPNFPFVFNLELQSIRDTTALNNSNLRFKKYTFRSFTPTVIFDVDFTNPVIILDRIGPLNTDLSVILSQGQGVYYTNWFSLICYQDSEVGLLKFMNRECNSRVAVEDINTVLRDFDIINYNEFISISLQNNDNEVIRNVKVYDVLGRLVLNITNNDKKNELNISKSKLPKGILIVNVESNNFSYKAKKVIINN
ncbi:MAG: T9SS type A sorting domain-containing protein [Saprospiraceae bacterium]|nr:T9SS type A sorting domain-containing protein [Saprospiraceae bacterium]